jgi:hypothetical protein
MLFSDCINHRSIYKRPWQREFTKVTELKLCLFREQTPAVKTHASTYLDGISSTVGEALVLSLHLNLNPAHVTVRETQFVGGRSKE